MILGIEKTTTMTLPRHERGRQTLSEQHTQDFLKDQFAFILFSLIKIYVCICEYYMNIVESGTTEICI